MAAIRRRVRAVRESRQPGPPPAARFPAGCSCLSAFRRSHRASLATTAGPRGGREARGPAVGLVATGGSALDQLADGQRLLRLVLQIVPGHVDEAVVAPVL